MNETPDIADVPPRANPDLIGHAAAERTLCEAHRSGRLPHGWLITGPRGIGKATLAFRFARYVLADQGGLFGAPGDLRVDPDSPVFRRVASGGHADLLTVERGVDERRGRVRSEIVVEDVRAVNAFLHMTPAEGGWRVVIVDSVDEMNRHAANAVLKILEEPPRQALLLLVSHAPARVLSTIRSRCRTLRLRPLGETELTGLLQRRRPDLAREEVTALARLAEGSPGHALALAEEGGLDLYRELLDLLEPLPDLDGPAVHALSESLGRPGADQAYRTVTELLTGWLARLIRHGAGRGPAVEVVPGEGALMDRLLAGSGLDQWLEVWEKLTRLFARADGANLDRRQVVLSALLAVEAAARS